VVQDVKERIASRTYTKKKKKKKKKYRQVATLSCQLHGMFWCSSPDNRLAALNNRQVAILGWPTALVVVWLKEWLEYSHNSIKQKEH